MALAREATMVPAQVQSNPGIWTQVIDNPPSASSRVLTNLPTTLNPGIPQL